MPTCAMCNAAEVSEEGAKCENCASSHSGSDNGGESSGDDSGSDSHSGM